MNGGLPDAVPDGAHADTGHSPAQQARTALQDLLQACSIARVVTVDDSNRQPADQEVDRDLIVSALRSGALTVEALMESAATSEIVTDDDGDPRDLEDVLYDIEVDPPRATGDHLRELTNAARLQSQTGQPPSGPASNKPLASRTEGIEDAEDKTDFAVDLDSLSALEDLFEEINFQALTLAEWRQQKGAILADRSPVLILFDRDFQRENASSTEGDRLIGEVLGKEEAAHVFCGMITHSATSPDDERQIADTIVGHLLHRDHAEVIVIARDNVQRDPIELARKIKAAVLARELISLRDLSARAMQDATHDGVAELKTLDAYTLLALVDAAAEEGAHDAHNILRIAATHSRQSLQRRIHGDDVTSGPLPRLWETRRQPPSDVLLQPPDNLARRRHADSFDDAEFLSSSHLPLEPGDIFQSVDPRKLLSGEIEGRKRRFILLTQPCDTMVRRDGGRTGSPRMFSVAPLEWIPDARRDDRVRTSDFRLDWFEPERKDGQWYVRLAARSQVPTRCLDACVLDREGTGRIEVGTQAPAALTEGWRKRHEKLQAWACNQLTRLTDLETSLTEETRQLVEASLLETAGELHTVKAAIDTRSKVIVYGIRRVARLSDPRTRALLTQSAQHLGRVAEEGMLFKEPSD